MSKTIIEVNNISKLYKLGTIGSGSLKQDLSKWFKQSVLKKDDPYFAGEDTGYVDDQDLWAVKNVSFDLEQGESLGIIGSNGSGKSTLLKIISRIVQPTTGYVKGIGKISSILEVGTGFHSDLTGRENIYISGYTLGMNKDEVKKKFDEIVAFSGIEKFLDTPIKRYSSGMYVRLAFAVAAHLEPDILIVDEVLAVGDADFQKKCLGKMREFSQTDGRTILFVSHSMQSINNLCSKALWLQNGKMRELGESSAVVNKYLSSVQQLKLEQHWDDKATAPGNEHIRFRKVELVPMKSNPGDPLDIRTPLVLKFQFWNETDNISLSTGFHLFSYSGECIFDIPSSPQKFNKGLIEGECTIPGNFLNDGSYFISLIVVKDTSVQLFYFEECISFDLEDYRGDIQWYGKWMGSVRPALPFRMEQKEPEF
ncbi:MAG: ABC transporter ATP-binding protein [Ferruginibacter sp.]|nr:ABC transporter ATP-binding protein [Ferruginibacter sp.]